MYRLSTFSMVLSLIYCFTSSTLSAYPMMEMLNKNTKALLAGGWSGNGGDQGDAADNVWFIGNEPVMYCIDRSPDFSISESEIRVIVRQSIDDWIAFFKRYELHNLYFDNSDHKGVLQFPDGAARGLSLDFKEVECKKEAESNYRPENLIHMLFGKSNGVVEAYKNLRTEHALGISLRTKYDHKTYRNGGYLWIDNFTDDTQRMKHMILHELGHVFGMKHNSVFVMDDQVASTLADKQRFDSIYFGNIESQVWKYQFEKGDKVLFTSLRGIRFWRLRLKSLPTKSCPDDTYLPADLLPGFVRETFGFDYNDCYRISIEVKGAISKKENQFLLVFENSRSTTKVTGYFRPSYSELGSHPGPGVFTLWKKDRYKSQNRKLLDFQWDRGVLNPFKGISFQNGFLMLEQGKKLAAKLKYNRGLMLEIFFDKPGKWWLLKAVTQDGKEK